MTRVASSPAKFAIASATQTRLLSSFDVVHAHHGEAVPLLLAATALKRRPPLLVTFHVDNRQIGSSSRSFVHAGRRYGSGTRGLAQSAVRSKVKHHLDRTALRFADKVSFISRSAATDVLDAGGEDATVVYNGLPELDSPKRGSASSPARVELLYVGTAGNRKRTALLPAILSHVRRSHPAARLRLVGFHLCDHPDLASDFTRRGLDAAIICEGPMTSSEIAPFYGAADLLVVPSAYEGLPMVILEAYQRGLPVVATAAGGHAEIIHDQETGFITPVDDVEAMAAAISRMLDDKTGSQAMGEQGRRIVASEFSVERQVDAYIDLYQSTVGTAQ